MQYLPTETECSRILQPSYFESVMATASGGNSYELLGRPGEVSIPMDSMQSQTSETEGIDDVDAAKREEVHNASLIMPYPLH